MENKDNLTIKVFEGTGMYNIEIWKTIDGLNGWYQVSTISNVRSIDRTINYANGRVRFHKGGAVKQQTHRRGYKYVFISSAGNERTKIYTHRLVALAFIPNVENKKEVNHIDCNKANNHISNLEWNTPTENARHAVRNGLKNNRFGKDNYNSIPLLDMYTGIYYDCITNAWQASDRRYKSPAVLRQAIVKGRINRYTLLKNVKKWKINQI